MASMNISITKEAYDFLQSSKQKDQSFTDIILTFKKEEKGKGRNIMHLFGALKNSNWKEKEKSMKKFREDFNRKLR